MEEKSHKYISFHTIFLIALSSFVMKLLITYSTQFRMSIELGTQMIILATHILSSASLFFILYIFNKRKQMIYLLIMDLLLTIILYANVVYYRFFNDFITIPVLMQTRTNGGQLSNSAFALIQPLDILFFIDLIVLVVLLTVFKVKIVGHRSMKMALLGLFLGIMMVIGNVILAEKERPGLFQRSFDRAYIVKYLGLYNFTLFDIYQNIHATSERAMADSEDVAKIKKEIQDRYVSPSQDYFQLAQNRNVIVVSMESLQDFVINMKIEGEEVTPFLNSLVEDEETFYFDQIYNQTGQGKTSDAEFILDNSLYGMPQGSAYVNKAQNTFQSTPGILKEYGYTSASFHGNYKTFWNRNEMYRSQGYDRFYDASYYDMNERNTKNYGLKDKPFFEESMSILQGLPEPFYAKFITLSNHFPFEMDEWDTNFPQANTNDKVVNQYFQSANYLDSALSKFFTGLKKSGLYDRSIIVLYGDHYGISENHNEAMAEIIGKEITPFESLKLQEVPVFIHIPGVKTGDYPQPIGGQLDIRPTLLHLLGVETNQYLGLGTDLLADGHIELTPLRNGDFVSNDISMINQRYYDSKSGKMISYEEEFDQLTQAAREKLDLSDEILTKDLLRFYHPAGFTPINREDYQYVQDDEAES
ncbi:LTA synthase family protein [Cytobacillus sp. FSL R7-0680]|uniref:LTA synthase family protein n=1 Tax=Cytobacillus sp. FSL R7-0680 TaxID=2921689 RepID=UPI0030F52BA5